jgi:hypothetical protein
MESNIFYYPDLVQEIIRDLNMDQLKQFYLSGDRKMRKIIREVFQQENLFQDKVKEIFVDCLNAFFESNPNVPIFVPEFNFKKFRIDPRKILNLDQAFQKSFYTEIDLRELYELEKAKFEKEIREDLFRRMDYFDILFYKMILDKDVQRRIAYYMDFESLENKWNQMNRCINQQIDILQKISLRSI